MSELRKANVPGTTYFLTLTVVGWIDVFTRCDYADIIITNLKFSQEKKHLDIFAYVIMPSHLHLIVRRNVGLVSDWLRDFKGYTSKVIVKAIKDNPFESRKEWMVQLFENFSKFHKQNENVMFWQKTNHPTELFSNEIFEQKLDYIHNNPVKAGIVNKAECYSYSSANPYSALKVLNG